MAGPSAIATPGIGTSAVGRGPSSLNVHGDPKAAQKAAKEFEAMFLSQMFGHMFEGIKTDGLFGGGNAEKIYRSLLVDEYGKAMANAGGIGIADQVMKEILRNQEASKP
ncbi:MAG: rod-binding protein [Alphaproteobacteria bacterium]|nr:rod-binding protein [Alphaproteobacteria bacterium]